MKKATHRVEGSADTRKSHRTYTHAVVADVNYGEAECYARHNGESRVMVWCMSEVNARKNMRHYERAPKFYSNVRLVPVLRDE